MQPESQGTSPLGQLTPPPVPPLPVPPEPPLPPLPEQAADDEPQVWSPQHTPLSQYVAPSWQHTAPAGMQPASHGTSPLGQLPPPDPPEPLEPPLPEHSEYDGAQTSPPQQTPLAQ
jgi:hypothetical protein